ncbi:MAG: hypothetical protein ACQEWV_13470 [Bacillota bacterium]
MNERQRQKLIHFMIDEGRSRVNILLMQKITTTILLLVLIVSVIEIPSNVLDIESVKKVLGKVVLKFTLSGLGIVTDKIHDFALLVRD